MAISTRPLGTTFGAEVSGVDLSKPQDAQTAQALRALWRQHELLLFRDQQLEERHVVDFSRNFGALEIHVRREYLSPDNPEILYVSNLKKDGKPVGILADTEVGWHYDQIYLPGPALGSWTQPTASVPSAPRSRSSWRPEQPRSARSRMASISATS